MCLLICLLQAEESLIGLCKAVVLHHKRSLEEVVIGGRASYMPEGGTSLDPLVPALLTCQKLTVLKLGPGTLSHTNTLTVLEELPNLQELVLRDVSIDGLGDWWERREGLRLWHPLDEVCLNTILQLCGVIALL